MLSPTQRAGVVAVVNVTGIAADNVTTAVVVQGVGVAVSVIVTVYVPAGNPEITPVALFITTLGAVGAIVYV